MQEIGIVCSTNDGVLPYRLDVFRKRKRGVLNAVEVATAGRGIEGKRGGDKMGIERKTT